ncbi:MAG: hypothetical protein Q7S88_00870 [Candidatus Daviesbacteria bacterium]|nr:hypothetical protein [Candidatus Daviesbacteria bacterium]
MLKFRWKVFVITVIGQFIMTSLLLGGAKVPNILSVLDLKSKPQVNLTTPEPQTPIFETIKSKLEIKGDSFKLRTKTSLVPSAFASAEYDNAVAYIVVDFETGEILAEKDSNLKIPIASITKTMTAMVALDLAEIEEIFTVSKRATEEVPTKVMLRAGEKATLELLINSLMVSSANDAAYAIADGIDQKYGAELFLRSMNEKAKLLDLKASSFTNPNGLDDADHLSSAEDVAIMSRYALKNYPQLEAIVKKELVEFSDPSGDERFNLRNWNGLLGVYPGVAGIKIGNTGRAGYTTSVVAEREGKKILVVVLGAPGVYERDLWAAELLDQGFSKFNIKGANVTRDQLKEKYASWKRD